MQHGARIAAGLLGLLKEQKENISYLHPASIPVGFRVKENPKSSL